MAPTGLLARGAALPHLLLAPITLAIALFYFGPIAFGVWASFQADGTTMTGGRFVGGEHYASLLRDRRFHGSIWITTVFTVSTVAATYVCGLAAALLLADTRLWTRDRRLKAVAVELGVDHRDSSH